MIEDLLLKYFFTKKNNLSVEELKDKNDNELTFDERLRLINSSIDDNNIITIIESLLDKNSINSNIIINDYVYQDCEMFGNYGDQQLSLFNKLNRCHTNFGTTIFKNILYLPVSDIEILINRQKCVKQIDNKISESITNHLLNISNIEHDLIWFWNSQKLNQINLLHDVIYFNIEIPFLNLNDLLNKNEKLLLFTNIYKIIIQPTLNIVTPVFTFIVTIVFLYYMQRRFGVDVSLWSMIKTAFIKIFTGENIFKNNPKIYYASLITKLLYLLLFIHNIHSSIESSKNTHRLINIIHNKLYNMSIFVEQVDNVYELCKDINIECYFQDIDKVPHCISHFKKIFNFYVFKIKPQLFSNKGKILSVYKIFSNIKNDIIILMNYVGYIDMINNVYLNIIKSDNPNRFCYTEYITSDRPKILVKEIWHPYLDNNSVIKNNIAINKNILLTGPNAGGKSTFIKSIIINILLSQTIGISSATKFKLTPFVMLETYLHIPDVKGKMSLFEAEMYRSKKYIDNLKLLDEKQFSFIVLDEIFSSTNYKEGFSGAYAVLKKICQFKNALFITTTHYTELNKLEKDTKGRIKNYKFDVNINKNEIIFNYKLKRGVSKQFIALKLLENNNFDKEIINNANKISKNLP
jgi:DNA mismatch repair protein MutS